MLDLIIIAGFLLSAALLYFCAVRLIDRIDPFADDSRLLQQTVWHIAVSDIVFLREINPFLGNSRCEFYTGSTSEIINDTAAPKMDALILCDDTISNENTMLMNRVKGRYYSSALSLRAADADLQVLVQKPHTVTVYYRNSFKDIMNTLISQGILVPVNDE